MADLTILERLCMQRIDKWRENYTNKGRWLTVDEITAAFVRIVLAEAGAVGEPEIGYEIWRGGDDTEALFFDEASARLYAATYGPVELVRAVTYRQKVQP